MNNIDYSILHILLFFYFVGLQSASVFIIGCPTFLKKWSYGSWNTYVYTSTARRRHDQFDVMISHVFLSLLL
jgi:hypothetical protein